MQNLPFQADELKAISREIEHEQRKIYWRSGGDLKVAQELLGHSSSRITADVYVHLQKEHQRAAAEASGQWIERRENIDVTELFEQMTPEELEVYARDGKLPAWCPASKETKRNAP